MLLKPIADANTIVEAYREYQLLKTKLLQEIDYQVIRGKKYIKKSGFRKLSTAFGISTSIVREARLNLEGYFVYEITVRATASSGRYSEACASCASNEREFSHIENDVRATAQTRWTNRAIADLIGSWEVSAEEIGYTDSKQDTDILKSDTRITNKETEYNFSELEDWKPVIERGFVHKNNRTYLPNELMTVKQKSLLIKLIETKYKDEQTRSGLFQRLNFLTKMEAGEAIKKMLQPTI